MTSGSVRKRVGKRGTTYQVIIEHGRTPDGSRDQRSHGTFKRKRDAQDCLDKTINDLKEGVYRTPSTIPLDAYVDHWFDTITVRASSAVRYRSVYRNHIGPVFGTTALCALTTEDIQVWFNLKRKRYRTADQMLVVLRSILDQAEREKKILGNPTIGVRGSQDRDQRQQRRVKQIRTWSADQLARFLALTVDDRDWPAWWVAAHTGVRPGELVALRWSDIDLDERTISISGTRTVINDAGHWIIGEQAKNDDSERRIGIDEDTVAVLTAYRASQNRRRLTVGPHWQDHDLVFDAGDGQPRDSDNLSSRFGRRTVYYGLPRLTLHGLRHTHGSILAASGRPLNYVQKRLGHATLATTSAYYLHLVPGTEYADADAFRAIMRQAR